MKPFFSRRAALQTLLASAAGPMAARSSVADDGEVTPVAAAAQPQGVCVLFPQAVEGPYYFDPNLVRADITEGKPGARVELVLDLIELGSCQPLANTRIDIWHADAGGLYSGYAGQGETRNVSTKGATYLRGTQTTNAQGRAVFSTVYPGWYPGRTPHIHIKAYLGKTELLTGQVYFPDDLSARIYRERDPYKLRPIADTTNGKDFIYVEGQREGGGTVLTIAETPELIKASLVIAVDRSGGAVERAQGLGARVRRWLGGRG